MKSESVKSASYRKNAEGAATFTKTQECVRAHLKRRFNKLDRRIQRMEDIITSRGFDWENRF